MTSLVRSAAGAALVLAVALAAPARADEARGRLLYENHCTRCHESTVHVRERRKASSTESLAGWIARWEQALDLGWNADDARDVLEYLNDRYYGFAPAGERE